MKHSSVWLLSSAFTLSVWMTSPLVLADLAQPASPPPPPAAPEKDLTVVQQPIADLAAPESELTVDAWVDRHDQTYAIGDEVTLSVRVSQDAYVTVLDVGTSGKVHVVFPNQYQSDNRIPAGEIIQIPDSSAEFALKVGGPPGSELLKIIATLEPTTLFDPASLQAAGPYKTVKNKDAAAVAKDLTVVLRDRKTWAEAEQVIRIVQPTAAVTGLYADSSVQWDDLEGFALLLRTDKMVYPMGDKVRVMVTATEDCRLTLLNVGTSGRIHILFPNRYQRDDMVRADQTVVIPSDVAPVAYELQGPTGAETLIGICRTDDQQVYRGNYDFDRYVYQPWGDSKTVSKDIGVVLREPNPAIAHTATTFWVIDR